MRLPALAALAGACLLLPAVTSAARPATKDEASATKGKAVAGSAKTKAAAAKLAAIEAKRAKKPSDAKLKLAAAKAHDDYATALETDDSLSSRVKYRQALQEFRKALALNPKLEDAKQKKDQIEDIYRSMHREIPK